MTRRKTINVHPVVKAGIEAITKDVGVKTESEGIAYLLAYYNRHRADVTLDEHVRVKAQVEQMHRQGSL